MAVPDEQWGERPKAFVTTRMEPVPEGKENSATAAIAATHLRGEDLVEWARSQPSISGFMVPREVEVVAELPKTATGKLRKNVLREWARGGWRDDGT